MNAHSRKCEKQADAYPLQVQLQHAAIQVLQAGGSFFIQCQHTVDCGFQHGGQYCR
jgi:hypothetical protein